MTQQTSTRKKRGGGLNPVIPPSLKPEVKKILQKALQPKNIDDGFRWVLRRIGGEDPLGKVLEDFFTMYEQKTESALGTALTQNRAEFQSALYQSFRKLLPYYRVRLADKGVNPIFVETWLERRLLAAMTGISPVDVEIKIRHSGRTPRLFLEKQLSEILPDTFLSDFSI